MFSTMKPVAETKAAQAPPIYILRNSVFIREGDRFHKLNISINYELKAKLTNSFKSGKEL